MCIHLDHRMIQLGTDSNSCFQMREAGHKTSQWQHLELRSVILCPRLLSPHLLRERSGEDRGQRFCRLLCANESDLLDSQGHVWNVVGPNLTRQGTRSFVA